MRTWKSVIEFDVIATLRPFVSPRGVFNSGLSCHQCGGGIRHHAPKRGPWTSFRFVLERGSVCTRRSILTPLSPIGVDRAEARSPHWDTVPEAVSHSADFWNRCGPFSAVSKPIFASKYAFCSIFQNLQDYRCTILDFCCFFKYFAPFSQFLLQFCKFSLRNTDLPIFCLIFREIPRNFAEIQGFW